jgi:hypothetical protein
VLTDALIAEALRRSKHGERDEQIQGAQAAKWRRQDGYEQDGYEQDGREPTGREQDGHENAALEQNRRTTQPNGD